MESGDGSVLGEQPASSSDSIKRRIPDSVVTKTAIPNAKRGKFSNRAHKAGWLTGTPPAARSAVSSQGWNERGRPKRGANRGGGRWTPRGSRRGYFGRRPWWIEDLMISSEEQALVANAAVSVFFFLFFFIFFFTFFVLESVYLASLLFNESLSAYTICARK